jgi:hypothetical protein
VLVPVLCVQVSLVLEYCDWGSVRTALDAGAFFAGEIAVVKFMFICMISEHHCDKVPFLIVTPSGRKNSAFKELCNAASTPVQQRFAGSTAEGLGHTGTL